MLAGTGSLTTMKRRRSSRSEPNGNDCSRDVAFALIAFLYFGADPPPPRYDSAPTIEAGSVGASSTARVAGGYPMLRPSPGVTAGVRHAAEMQGMPKKSGHNAA